jgi:hypothetical protein
MSCTNFARRGGDHPVAALSAVTPLNSSSIAPRGRSLTPTSTTMSTGMTPAIRATIRRRTASDIITRRRSFRRSCHEHVLP